MRRPGGLPRRPASVRAAGAARVLLAGVLLLLPLEAAGRPGDAVRGRALFESRCSACHSLEHDRVGPALGGIVGRTAGSRPEFDYSPALAAAAFAWTPQLLEQWLSNPQALVPGQRMPISIGRAEDRADVVAYLRATASPSAP